MKQYSIIILIAAATLLCSCNEKPTNSIVESKTEIANGTATSTFKVWGNCEMCNETIEESLKINGVLDSKWDTETKAMVISYDTAKISLDQIQKTIASVGYDTENYKGSDIAYKDLPECCQYDRK